MNNHPFYTDREWNAVERWKTGKAGIRWHSMACTCDECLNADALSYIYLSSRGYVFANFNGLTNDSQPMIQLGGITT